MAIGNAAEYLAGSVEATVRQDGHLEGDSMETCSLELWRKTSWMRYVKSNGKEVEGDERSRLLEIGP